MKLPTLPVRRLLLPSCAALLFMGIVALRSAQASAPSAPMAPSFDWDLTAQDVAAVTPGGNFVLLDPPEISPVEPQLPTN